MMTSDKPTIGKQEDERAYAAWFSERIKSNRHRLYYIRNMREAFMAGKEHGLEMRGCCGNRDDGHGKVKA